MILMKICFLSPSIQGVGGQERVTSLIANSLANLQNFEVSIAFTTGNYGSNKFAYDIDPNISIIWDKRLIRRKYKYVPSKIYRVLYKNKIAVHKFSLKYSLDRIISKTERKDFENFFHENNFDIVIAVGPHLSGVVGMLNISEKKVGWLHSSYERYFETYQDYLWNQGDIYSQAFNGLDKLIVLTPPAKKRFGQKTNAIVKSISNPLPVSESSYKFNGGRTLIFVGRLVMNVKGLDKLLRSISLLKDNTESKFKLLIVGEGPDYQKLTEIVFEKQLEDVVEFVGSTTSVEKYYKESDILLLPSRAEGFGLVVIEGMAYGLPVVSYTTEGPSEIVVNGKEGFLVEDFDEFEFYKKIHILLNDLQLRKDMSESAYLESKRYTLRNVVSEWEKMISEL